MNRWPRTHERTNTRDTVKREPAAEPKPWLHRRSVRNAPAPTALRVEPWDSEILRTLTDNACRDCGYAKCACPENAIAKDGPPPFVAPGKPQHATFDRECFGPDPAPKAGEREVRVGDVWRYDETGHCYRITDAVAVIGDCVASPNGQWPRPGNAGCHLTIGAPGDRWTLLSRAQPYAVDDGAVNWRDCATAEEALKAAGLVYDGCDWNRGDGHVTNSSAGRWGAWRGGRMNPVYAAGSVGGWLGNDWRAAIAHALGESPSIARGQVPT